MEDVMKKIRLGRHETGNDCRFKDLKCFERIDINTQKTTL